MDRDSTAYTVLQYALMIGLVLVAVSAMELAAGEIPIWAGLVVAAVIGLGYPWVTRKVGVAPTHWK